MGKADTVQAGIPAWLNALIGIGGLSALVSGLGLMWKNHRDANLADKKDERDARKDDVAAFSEWMAASVESAKEAAEARRDAREAREEAQETRAELVNVRRDLTSVQTRLTQLEDDQQVLIGYVTVVVAGVEAGTVPPLPQMPPQVQAVLSHITRKE